MLFISIVHIIISLEKQIMFLAVFVCMSFFLLLCLSARKIAWKSYELIVMKFSRGTRGGKSNT